MTSSLNFLLVLFALLCVSNADFLSRNLQSAGPMSQNCSPGMSPVCDSCGSSSFYRVAISEFKNLKPNLLQFANSLSETFSSATLDVAEGSAATCIIVQGVQALANGQTYLNLIKNNFQTDLASEFQLPFVNFEAYQLNSLSFRMNSTGSYLDLDSVVLRSDSNYTVSKGASFQEFVLVYDANENTATLTGTLTLSPFYRKLKFTAELVGDQNNEWEIKLETEHDNVGKFVGSFTYIPENSDNSIYRKLFSLFPSHFQAEVELKDRSFKIKSSTLNVIQKNETFDIIPTILTVKSISSDFGFYSLEEKNPDVQFVQKCTFSLLNSFEFEGTVERSARGDQLVRAKLPQVRLSDIMMKEFSDSGLKDFLIKLGLDKIILGEGEVKFTWGIQAKALALSGKIKMDGLDLVSSDFIATRDSSGKKALCAGLNFPFSGIGLIVNKFFSVPDLSKVLSTFSGSSISLLLAYNDVKFQTIPELRPSYTAFLDYWTESLRSGITIYAEIRFSSNTDGITNYLRKILGSDRGLLLMLNLQLKSLSASISITNVTIAKGLVLNEGGIFFTAGAGENLEFGIRGSLTVPVKDDNLLLLGQLSFTPVAANLAFEMRNIWKSPFKIERLNIGNLLLAGSISYAGVPSGLRLGGQVAVGLNCFSEQNFIGEGYCLNGKGYVGVDATEPSNNFLYLEVSKLNLDVILRALFGSKTEQKVVIPEFIRNVISFPEGFKVSFALMPQSVGDLNIPEGFRLKGKVNFFDANGAIDIVYSTLAMKFLATLTISPINIFNVIVIDSYEPGKGLSVSIEARLLPPVLNVDISATVKLLGFQARTKVLIDSSRFSLLASGNIFGGLFTADIAVEADYSSFKSAAFSVAGSLQTNQALLNLAKEVCNKVGQALQDASVKVKEARSKVAQAQSDVDSKQAKVCSNIDTQCAKKGSCKTSKDECKQYGTKMQCDKTEKQCTGGWKDECSKSSKQCSKKLPSWLGWACGAWSYVCTETSKICQAWGDVCTLSKEVVDFSNCKVRETICTAYETVVDGVCKAACETAGAGLKVAVGAMEAAKGVLLGTEKSLGALSKAADAIGNNFSQIFNIKQAGFKFTLTVGTQSILVDFSAVIMGSNYDFSYELNFRDLAESSSKIADIVKERVKSMFS